MVLFRASLEPVFDTNYDYFQNRFQKYSKICLERRNFKGSLKPVPKIEILDKFWNRVDFVKETGSKILLPDEEAHIRADFVSLIGKPSGSTNNVLTTTSLYLKHKRYKEQTLY